MIDTYIYVVEGLDIKADVEPRVRRSAVRAVNKAATQARTASSRAIRDIVNLPASYLSPSGGRLNVTQKANNTSLEAVVTGRRRPTSLARYTNGKVLDGQAQRRSRGVSVKVAKAGTAKRIKRAFLIRLRGAGGDLTNIGLAVRTDGEAPRGAFKPKKLADNLWLVYGMSVDKLFNRVVGPLTPEILDNMQREFLRQTNLEGL